MNLRGLVLCSLVGLIGCGDDDRRPPVDAATDTTGDATGDAGACEGRCAGDFPFCVESTGDCVACLGLEGCEAGFVCEAGTCQAPGCATSAECVLPAASRCDPDESVCSPCEGNDDCAHLGSLCDEGLCVPPPADPTCMPCDDDSPCSEAGGRCIFMRVAGELLDQGYCALPAPEGAAECESAPFTFRIRGRASVDGTSVDDFCSINEGVTSCAALNDARSAKPCESDGDCGVMERIDSRCISSVCMYRCRAANQCEAGLRCWDGEVAVDEPGPPPPTSLYCGS